MSRLRLFGGGVVTAALLLACAGSGVEEPGSETTPEGAGGTTGTDPSVDPNAGASGTPLDPTLTAGTGGTASACDPSAAVDPGPSPLQRLTPIQYRNTINDVFAGVVDTTQLFPNEVARAHIGLQQPDVSQFEVETYANYAELVASAAAGNLDQFAPCDAAADLATASACMQTFLNSYGPRLYRSPLSEADIQRLLSIFEPAFTASGYARGFELTLAALLQSPRFLYRPEFGDAAAAPDPAALAVPLSGYELASRLSFAFWNSTPDTALLAAAANGSLLTQVGRDAEVARLIADPRARDSFRNFLYAWLGMGDLDSLVKDRPTFPTWQDDTPGELKKQSDAFFDEVLFGQSGTLSSFFTLPLGDFAPATLSDWAQNDATAVGVLTLPALLATHSKANESFPIYRGLLVREQILCQPLPPPPPAAAVNPPEAEPGVSTRERFEQHSVDAACSGCHRLIDPIGFAFESYDAIGRFRTDDRGLPIDVNGALTGTDVDGPFSGVTELANILQGSALVQRCTSRQWFRYVLQRFDQASDACSTQAITDAFVASGARFESLRSSVTHTQAFLNRRRIEPAGAN